MGAEYQKVLDSCADAAGKAKSGWYAEQSAGAKQGRIFGRRSECFLTDLKSIDREVMSMMKEGNRNMLCKVIRECELDETDRLLLYFSYGAKRADYYPRFPKGLEEQLGNGNSNLMGKFSESYEKLKSLTILSNATTKWGRPATISMTGDFLYLIRYNFPPRKIDGCIAPSPTEIYEYLSRWVIGQDRAKKAISIAASRHYLADSTKQMPKSNILLAGPTGSGKTYLAKKLADRLRVPIVFCSANEFTSSGYVGRKVGEILISLLKEAGSRERAEKGIVFIDEVDKIIAAKRWAGLDVAGRRVQEELLNIIESDRPREVSTGDWPPRKTVFNARNVLFIAAGAFAGMEEVEQHAKKLPIGFGAGADARQEQAYRSKTEDFIQYGLIPEFIGRFPNIIMMDRLDREDMYNIMVKSAGSPALKFNSLAAEYGAKLFFTESALYAIADEAVARGLGARGLQGILEEVLQDYLLTPENSISQEIVVGVERTRDGIKFKCSSRKKRESETVSGGVSVFDLLGRRKEEAHQGKVAPGHSSLACLNPEYTFDKFVVSGVNQFTHAACLAVAEAPGKAYNPLFIYGGAGLGIPHLMHAIGWFLLKRRVVKPKVVLVSAKDFVNDLKDACEKGNLEAFRQKYRSADLLLFEDIQLLAGNENAQEELLYTFDALYDAHKQIIISSDRQPKEIPMMEERLVSRFDWGLISDIQPPDLENRIAILKKKCEMQNIAVPEDIILFIANKIKFNIRELEGALTKTIAYASLNKRELNLECAQEALKDIIPKEKPVTIELIQAKTADYFDLNLCDMKKNNRSKNIALPRQIAMYLARELTQHSLTEIGEAFGGMDHLTIIHAHKKIRNGLEEDRNLARMVEELKQKISE